MTHLGYMAIDQYGHTYHMGYVSFPRTWLLRHLNKQRAEKMYCDTTDGTARHIGWIIGGLWLSVYEVRPMDGIRKGDTAP